MEISVDKVLAALGTVDDPDLKKDLVTLNMVKEVVVNGQEVSFTVVLTTPACPLKEVIRKSCEQAIYKLVSPDVSISINMIADVTAGELNQGEVLPQVKNIIAISSGKGGVGKSTVASNLAIALSKEGARVGLVDADIFGPSVPTMFDLEGERPGVVQEDGKTKIIPIKKYGIDLISIGFLAPSDNAIVWRGPMASSALKQFFSDVNWPELDYLLIDLPPGTSDIHLTMVQTVPVTGAVVVTTPQKVALADAKKGLAMFSQGQINVPVLGVIENMSYFTPEELPDNKYYIFGKDGGKNLAAEKDIAFLGEVPIVQSVREGGDNGRPVILEDELTADSFKQIAKNVAQQVAIRNANQEKTKTVEVKV
jgi:ATP-binding protein involved in chromosome partitioning